MSVQAPVQPDQTATATPQLLQGAAVYDADGYRVGLVESAEPQAGRFTVVQAGCPLGVLGGSLDVPVDWVWRADAERVELLVPARALEEQR